MIHLRGDKPNLLYDKKVVRDHAVKLTKLEKGQKISILSDAMLKTMFFSEERKKYSCKFLSYYLDVSYEELLNHISLIKNELDKENSHERNQRCDYIARVHGTTIGIEVNNNSSISILERNIEYAHKAYRIKYKEREKELYHQVIQINMNNFAFQGNDKIVDQCVLQNDEGIWLLEKIMIVNIYIPNLRKKWYDVGIEGLEERERYLLALVEPDIEISENLGEGNILMEEYIKDAQVASEEMDLGVSYDLEWALKDEGKREGREEMQKQFALSMLKIGEDVDKIIQMTGLDLEDVTEIAEKNNLEIKTYKSDGDEPKKQIALAMLNKKLDRRIILECTGLTEKEFNELENSITIE